MSFPLYAPEICPPGWVPTFDASLGPCVLTQGDVNRSRLTKGGTFFRSVETGATSNVNNIAVVCTVTQTSGDGTANDVYSVVINYTDEEGAAQPAVSANQTYDNVGGSWTSSPMASLRIQLSGSSVMTMPADDTKSSGWLASSMDADHMTTFADNLSGGVGIPDYTVGIRTGPTFALFHVGFDDSADNGDQVEVNATKEWDGVNAAWIDFPSDTYKLDSDGTITPTPPCP